MLQNMHYSTYAASGAGQECGVCRCTRATYSFPMTALVVSDPANTNLGESHMSGAMSVTPTMSIQNSIHASVTLLTQVQAVE